MMELDMIKTILFFISTDRKQRTKSVTFFIFYEVTGAFQGNFVRK